MPWVRIDDNFAQHPKVIQAGPLGIALQVAGLCYANRHLTDGFIPRAATVTLLDFSGLAVVGPTNDLGVGSGEDVAAQHVIALLVELGIWEEAQGGYQIHDYDKYQDSRETVLANRAKTRDRVAKWRSGRTNKGRNAVTNAATNANGNGVSNRAPTPTPTVTTGDPIATGRVTPGVEQARPIDNVSRIFQAWQDSTGKHRAQLDDNRRRAIEKALTTYPADDVLDAVQGWVNDPWPERAQQNDICQLLHTGTVRKPLNVLEKMRDLWRTGPPATAGRRTQELARNAVGLRQAFLAREGVNGGDPRMGAGRAPAQRELPRPAGGTGHSP